MQKKFIDHLKENSLQNVSFVDEVADVLDIGYDAAYRRVMCKTNLSLEEGVILSKHFNISLNNLFEVGNQNTVITELSPRPIDETALELWFRKSNENITALSNIKSASIIYSAKDIPLFYTLKDTLLSRYKIYVWLKDVNVRMAKNKISFEDFLTSIPNSLIESAIELGESYNFIDISELWNDNTINGTLQQILYYFKSELLSTEIALEICQNLEDVINHAEKQTIRQSIIGSKNNASYHLYKSELHTMNNTIMVKTKQKKIFFQPFTVLTYFKVEHQPTCQLMYDFFKMQMANSKLLVNSGEKDRSLFFNKMRQKIKLAKNRIQIGVDESFL